MTDEQIIKALECCATDDGDDCFQCPYGNIVYKPGNGGCVNRCRKDALNLINRQKEEIERLKKKNKILIKNADTAFQDGLDENRDLFKKEVEPEIRAEAIKEFAERVEQEICKNTYAGFDKKGNPVNIWEAQTGFKDIDNLVKEMTEESE